MLVVVGNQLLAGDRVHVQPPDLDLRAALAPRVTLFILKFFDRLLLFDAGVAFLAAIPASLEVAALVEGLVVLDLLLLVLDAPDRLVVLELHPGLRMPHPLQLLSHRLVLILLPKAVPSHLDVRPVLTMLLQLLHPAVQDFVLFEQPLKLVGLVFPGMLF